MKPASMEIAERNSHDFNEALRTLAARKGGGLEWYEIRGSSIYEYDPLTREIFRSVDLHGYRTHSLCAKQPLTAEEQDDLENEIQLGLADIYIRSNIDALNVGRYWHGVSNMPAPRKHWDENKCAWVLN